MKLRSYDRKPLEFLVFPAGQEENRLEERQEKGDQTQQPPGDRNRESVYRCTGSNVGFRGGQLGPNIENLAHDRIVKEAGGTCRILRGFHPDEGGRRKRRTELGCETGAQAMRAKKNPPRETIRPKKKLAREKKMATSSSPGSRRERKITRQPSSSSATCSQKKVYGVQGREPAGSAV